MIDLRPIVSKLFAIAQDRAPVEACGVAAGINGEFFHVRELDNISSDPCHTFLINEIDFLIEVKAYEGFDLALWHSHPVTRAVPSHEDQVLLEGCRVPMVIVSLHPYLKIAAFAWESSQVREIGRWRPEGVAV